MNAVDGRSEKKLIFVHGVAGAGKTYLFQVLEQELERRGTRGCFSAYNGSVSQMYQTGTTCHSTFGIPLKFPDTGMKPRSWFPREHHLAKRLEKAPVHVLGEITMMKEWQLEVVNSELQVTVSKLFRPLI